MADVPKTDGAKGYVTAEVIGQLLDGLTARRIQQLARAGIIPKAERGQYHWPTVVREYVRYLKAEVDRSAKARSLADAPPEVKEVREIERRTKLADMAIREADAALRLGQLTTVAAAERILGEYAARVRAVHSSASSRYARRFPELTFTESMQRLQKIFDAVERSLQRDDDLPGDPNSEAAA